MAFRLLLTGDLHLGRASSRLPPELRLEARAATAWARLIEVALAERVSAVVLSGDVADESNRFWEAIGPLEAGVNRLAGAGIPVVAVAGNHDHAVLGRLADQLPREHFALLGRGGTWERRTLTHEGRAWLNVDGWSFPQAVVRASPLDSYALPPDPDVPTLGLVHGDLGVGTSTYGPLDLARLQALPPRAWLLGHIHAPRLEAAVGRPWVLMPGSPQALDPGETGPHGPWIAEVEGSRLALPVQRPLSAAWYHEAALDVSGAADEPALEALVLDFLRARAADIAGRAGDALAHVSLRLRLVGASPLSDRVRDVAGRLRQDLSLPAGRATLVLDDLRVETTPKLDLEAHARTTTALGAVARLLLELRACDALDPTVGATPVATPAPTVPARPDVSDETRLLLRSARQALERVEGAREFLALDRPPVTDERVREVVRVQASALLTLLARSAS